MRDTRKKFKDPSEGYREEVRERHRTELALERDRMRSEGKHPYEGHWRTLNEIKGLQTLMRRKDRTIFRDLIVLTVIFVLLIILLTAYMFSI
jgi:hypothetical protein